MGLKHRDHQNAIKAKRMSEDLADEEASHIEELLAADQQREHERQGYQQDQVKDEK